MTVFVGKLYDIVFYYATVIFVLLTSGVPCLLVIVRQLGILVEAPDLCHFFATGGVCVFEAGKLEVVEDGSEVVAGVADAVLLADGDSRVFKSSRRIKLSKLYFGRNNYAHFVTGIPMASMVVCTGCSDQSLAVIRRLKLVKPTATRTTMIQNRRSINFLYKSDFSPIMH